MEVMLVEDHLDFSSPWHFSNVVLVVGKTKFHVHKCILSLWSPVFNTMFTSQFKESKAKEIRLPGKRADEMKVLLKLIYSSGTKQSVAEENYQFLLQLADEYQMDRVKSMCSDFLVKKIQVSNCLEFFKLSEKFGLDDVTEKCHQEVRYTSSDDLEGSEHFNGFDPEFKLDICMKVIRELERTLQEYVKTCSYMVKVVYQRVHNSCWCHGKDLDKHVKEHHQIYNKLEESLGGGSLSPEFQMSCKTCIHNVIKNAYWNNTDGGYNYSIIKQPVIKLYDLQQNNKVAAREARKMDDKLKEKSQ